MACGTKVSRRVRYQAAGAHSIRTPDLKPSPYTNRPHCHCIQLFYNYGISLSTSKFELTLSVLATLKLPMIGCHRVTMQGLNLLSQCFYPIFAWGTEACIVWAHIIISRNGSKPCIGGNNNILLNLVFTELISSHPFTSCNCNSYATLLPLVFATVTPPCIDMKITGTLVLMSIHTSQCHHCHFSAV